MALLAFAPVASASAPKLSVSNVSAGEGDGKASFVVTLSKASKKDVKVHYATKDATAVAPGDYKAKDGTLKLPAGKKSKTVKVSIVDDSTQEETETFKLHLSKPEHASIDDANGVGTITDDDAPSTVTITYSVPLSWGKISCDGAAAQFSGNCVFPSGTASVVLTTATEDSTYSFDHWYGDTCDGSATGATMTLSNLTADHECQAIYCFTANPSACANPNKTDVLGLPGRRFFG